MDTDRDGNYINLSVEKTWLDLNQIYITLIEPPGYVVN